MPAGFFYFGELAGQEVSKSVTGACCRQLKTENGFTPAADD
jgi:hypothetical protein